ncbi:NAD kinase [Spirochaetia bacterium]|nr:NAD kinase [Spirochaetia bacterium]
MAESGSPKIRGALLFINLHKDHARRMAGVITNTLESRGIRCYADSAHPGDCDIAFTLGGDGTVLYAARIAAPLKMPIFPINLGTLGFIAAVPPAQWEAVFDRWLLGEAEVSERLMLEFTVERGGQTVLQGSCLNDAVISASGIAKIIHLHVESEFIRLGQYRADGLILATPTGSTAYSAAAGGPILDPEMEALIINPICPFTLSNRPVVLSAKETVIIEVEAEQRSGVLLTVDGQVTEPLEPGDRVSIRQAPYKARLIASGREAFYRALRSKLNWSAQTEAAQADTEEHRA